MQAGIPFPDISPEIFSIDLGFMVLSLRWYALAYIVGMLIGLWIVQRLVRAPRLWPDGVAPMRPDQPEALLTWVILGVILGGRLGFVLFYEPAYYLTRPLEILRIWEGGMSFHGGMLGVLAAVALFARQNALPLASVFDAMAVATPPGLLLGRLANFVNAELWGRPTTVPWAVIFPGDRAQECGPDWVGLCARHPSQLYEAALEGLVLGALLLWLAWRRGGLKVPGMLTGVFALGYGLARSFVEHFRQADAQFVTPDNPWGQVLRFGSGPDAWGLTLGQVLSLPMAALGLAIILLARGRARARARAGAQGRPR